LISINFGQTILVLLINNFLIALMLKKCVIWILNQYS